MSKKIIAALGIVGFLASAGAAFAQTTTATAVTSVAPTATEQKVLQISPKGNVILRGTVSAVSTGSVTVKSWGGDWTVNVPTTASVFPQGSALSDFKAGDFVGVQGAVDSSASWTVNATLIRDWTERQVVKQEIKTNITAVQQAKATAPKTIRGVVSNLDATAKTFTLTSAAGTTYSVSLSSSALLLTNNRATLDLSKVKDGDMGRVYGTVSSSAISASIFRDVSVK